MSYSLEVLTAFSDALAAFYSGGAPADAFKAALPAMNLMLGSPRPAIQSLPGRAPAVRARGEGIRVESEMFGQEPRDHFLILDVQLEHSAFRVTFTRPRPFTGDEHYLLELLQDHLPKPSTDPQSRCSVEMDNWTVPVSGSRIRLGADCAQILTNYFPAGRSRVPGEVKRWLCHHQALSSFSETDPVPIWVIERPGGRLRLQLCRGDSLQSWHLRVREERGSADYYRLRAIGLTTRECEVVFWISQGKRDAEIASILGCAPKTVGKHVENLLRKLGGETRLAAAHVAQEWLRHSA